MPDPAHCRPPAPRRRVPPRLTRTTRPCPTRPRTLVPNRAGVSRETNRSASAAVRTGHPAFPGGTGASGTGRCRADRGSGGDRRRSGGGGVRARTRCLRARYAAGPARRGRRRTRTGRVADRTCRPPGERGGHVRAARAAAGAGRRAGTRMAEHAAHRLTRRAGHPWRGRAGRLLRALSAPARSRGGGAGRRTRADRHRRLGVGGRHRGDPAAHPALHGAHRLGHPVPDGPSVAAAVAAVGAFPGRGRRAADAEGLRPGEGTGGVGAGDHLGVPAGHAPYAADRLPVVLRAGTAVDPVGRPGGRGYWDAPGPRGVGPRHRTRRAHPGPGGVSAAAAGGHAVPRGGGGAGGGGGGLRGAGDGPGDPLPHRPGDRGTVYGRGRARPGWSWRV